MSTEPHFSVLIWSEANAGFLRERFGATITASAGEIYAAFVPYSKVRPLLQSTTTRFVELTRALMSNLDYTRGFTQADALHGLSHTGAGVIIGNCEYEGLDLHHPDFADPNTNSSRVLAYWDQRLTATSGEAPPSSMGGFTGGWGVEYDQAQINQELGTYPPGPTWSVVRLSTGGGLSHPTAVVGCAAGNGTGSSGQFAGLAPGSDIIAARIYGLWANLYLWWTDYLNLLAGISYVFEKAALLGKPCVVNISTGDNGGPHDGSMLGDRFLDELLNQSGRAITASAGNSNNTGCHAYGQVQQSSNLDLKLNFGPFPFNPEYVEIWYDGHDRFSVSVFEPGQSVATVGPVPAPSGLTNPVPCIVDSSWQVQVTSTVSDARNGDNVIGIAITRQSGTNPAPLNDWTIRIYGDSVINGTFHAWTGRYNRYNVRWKAPFLLEDHGTVGSPGTGRNVITVGNHDKTIPTPVISPDSGCGPTRDGRSKPDIASVGQLIAPIDRDLNNNPSGPLYGPVAGTSFSSPVVAGACALLFQCRGPWASWGNLRQILQNRAGTTGLTIPSDAFGSGFLQLETACSAPASDVDVWIKDHPLDNGVQPFTGPVAWMSPDIQLYDKNGVNPVLNAIYDPTNRYNHQVFVTVRNRGTQKARNTEVYFYWADPATQIPFPNEWRTSGIYADAASGFANQTNKIVISELAAGANETVAFAWAPPMPSASINTDGHFCLLVRVENAADPSLVESWTGYLLADRNNIAQRNLLVVEAAGTPQNPSSRGFYIVGTKGIDGLSIRKDFPATVELTLPARTLPWREGALLERNGPRPNCPSEHDWIDTLRRSLVGQQVEDLTAVVGANSLELRDGLARIGFSGERLFVPRLRASADERVQARIGFPEPVRLSRQPEVHVMQLSDGNMVGGVTIHPRMRRSGGRATKSPRNV